MLVSSASYKRYPMILLPCLIGIAALGIGFSLFSAVFFNNEETVPIAPSLYAVLTGLEEMPAWTLMDGHDFFLGDSDRAIVTLKIPEYSEKLVVVDAVEDVIVRSPTNYTIFGTIYHGAIGGDNVYDADQHETESSVIFTRVASALVARIRLESGETFKIHPPRMPEEVIDFIAGEGGQETFIQKWVAKTAGDLETGDGDKSKAGPAATTGLASGAAQGASETYLGVADEAHQAEIAVMVVYTPQARMDAGGTAAALAIIHAGIDMTNHAFKESKVHARFKLAHYGEIDYREETGDGGIILKRFRKGVNAEKGAQKIFLKVRDWKKAVGADLVCLMTGTTSGRGYRITAPIRTDYNLVYTVSNEHSFLHTLQFAHECGHVLGLSHDSTTNNPASYYNGHRLGPMDEPSRFAGTIMSHPLAGTDWKWTRIERFSNPKVRFRGVPTGVAAYEENDADSAKALNEVVLTAMAWNDTPDQFIVSNKDGEALARFSSSGYVIIRGELRENVSIGDDGLAYTDRDFLIRDGDGIVVAFIDAEGNLNLAGRLYENVTSSLDELDTSSTAFRIQGEKQKTVALINRASFPMTPAIAGRRAQSDLNVAAGSLILRKNLYSSPLITYRR